MRSVTYDLAFAITVLGYPLQSPVNKTLSLHELPKLFSELALFLKTMTQRFW